MTKDTWGPWIAHRPGDPCPIPDAAGGTYELRLRVPIFEGHTEYSAHNPAIDWDWSADTPEQIIAYRLRLRKEGS